MEGLYVFLFHTLSLKPFQIIISQFRSFTLVLVSMEHLHHRKQLLRKLLPIHHLPLILIRALLALVFPIPINLTPLSSLLLLILITHISSRQQLCPLGLSIRQLCLLPLMLNILRPHLQSHSTRRPHPHNIPCPDHLTIHRLPIFLVLFTCRLTIQGTHTSTRLRAIPHPHPRAMGHPIPLMAVTQHHLLMVNSCQLISQVRPSHLSQVLYTCAYMQLCNVHVHVPLLCVTCISLFFL